MKEHEILLIKFVVLLLALAAAFMYVHLFALTRRMNDLTEIVDDLSEDDDHADPLRVPMDALFDRWTAMPGGDTLELEATGFQIKKRASHNEVRYELLNPEGKLIARADEDGLLTMKHYAEQCADGRALFDKAPKTQWRHPKDE